MIRINLLPHKREVRRSSGQGWLVVIAVVLFANFVVLFLFHQMKEGELDKQRVENKKLEDQIAQSRAQVQDHEKIKQELEVSRALDDAIKKLQVGRAGPTAVLLELSRVLSKDRGPTPSSPDAFAKIIRERPYEYFKETWDVRRLWMLSYKENQRVVRLEGFAHDGEDVSELARRLMLSKYFYDVVLLPAKQQVDSDSRTNMVRFQLQAKARY